jgi:hypothetical protein
MKRTAEGRTPAAQLAVMERAELGTETLSLGQRMRMANDMAALPPEMVYQIALNQPTFEGYRNAFYMAGLRPIINEPVMDRYVVREVKPDGVYYYFGNRLRIEKNDGRKEYYKNGKLHRDGDLPAYEDVDGYKEYHKHGKLHRDGGLPAVEWPNGTKQYWIWGRRQYIVH